MIHISNCCFHLKYSSPFEAHEYFCCYTDIILCQFKKWFLSGLTFSDVSYVYTAYCCYIAFILEITLETNFMVTRRQIPTDASKFDFWVIRKHFQTYVFHKGVFQQPHIYFPKFESSNWYQASTQVFANKWDFYFNNSFLNILFCRPSHLIDTLMDHGHFPISESEC